MASDEQPTSRKSVLRESVETVVLVLLIYALVRTFLFENYRVLGQSMEPSLENDQFLMVNKLGYRLHEPERGDIVVFRDPNSDRRKLIKRVIGLPGEVVEVRNGQVFINDRLLQEPYVAIPARYSHPPVPIPEGSLFVLGDNRNNSSDSHNWGPLPRERIVGRAWISYWPPRLWGPVRHEAYSDLAPGSRLSPLTAGWG
jgi:signal peptidase I